MLLPII